MSRTQQGLLVQGYQHVINEHKHMEHKMTENMAKVLH